MTITGLLPHRERHGWSQADLAARAGIAPSTVHRIETGRSLGTAGILVRLADALQITLDELIGRTVPSTNQAPAASSAKRSAAGARHKE